MNHSKTCRRCKRRLVVAKNFYYNETNEYWFGTCKRCISETAKRKRRYARLSAKPLGEIAREMSKKATPAYSHALQSYALEIPVTKHKRKRSLPIKKVKWYNPLTWFKHGK